MSAEVRRQYMCKECGCVPCLASCPNFSGELAGRGTSAGICSLCGLGIYSGETFYRKGSVIICSDCLGDMHVSCLALVCDLFDSGELLESLGFEKHPV